MKKIAVTILLLFVASLTTSAFAAGCMMPARSMHGAGQSMQMPCCDDQDGCADHACASGHRACLGDNDAATVTQKHELQAVVVKTALQPSTLTAIPKLLANVDPAGARPPELSVGAKHRYSTFYARTGRLLI